MRRSLMLAACLFASLPGLCHADGFAIAVGGGGHCHHGYCGPGWGFSYWAPPPPRYYYVPPPVVQYVQPAVIQQPVIVQQPAPLAAAPAPAPATPVASNRLPSPPTRAASTGSPVIIRNSSGKGVPVAFLVDEQSQELRDGQTRSFNGSSHVVEYDRGGDLGTARYELSSGLYTFLVGDNGWELVRDSNTRTADRPIVKRNELPIEVSR